MLQIRYHPLLNGHDTLLFAGSRKDIERLWSFLSGWNGEELDLIKNLKVQKELYQLSAGGLHLKRDKMKSAFSWTDDQGTWLISAMVKETYVSLLENLLENDSPGHQHLDYVGPGHVQIIVSKNEPPLSGSGKKIERFVLSKEGISFTPESVAVVGKHVKSYQRGNLVPCLSTRVDNYNQCQILKAGNNLKERPDLIPDQLEDASFYWSNHQLDELRKKYFVDLEFQRNSYLIPLPEN